MAELALFNDLQPAPAMQGSAVFSPCERYRYSLLREWDDTKPRVVFIMLNPSTADAERNDPTVAKCIRYAKGWGYGCLEVLNLFAYRSTDPKELYKVENPEGLPENNERIIAAMESEALIVCAWGKHGNLNDRGLRVKIMALQRSRYLHCLALNEDGTPSHPLYLLKTLEPIRFGGGRG